MTGLEASGTPAPAQGGAAPGAVEPIAALPAQPGEAARKEQAPPPPQLLEPVEPLLELIAAAQADNGITEQPGSGFIDELLLGKHAGKNKADLQRSLTSVKAVLELQSHPDALPKDKILSPEALQALGIEASWLKEHIGP